MAIVPANLHPWCFLSNIFLMEKRDWGYRQVMNEWLTYHHFKMESVHLLMDILQGHYWMIRMDIKDACLMILIFSLTDAFFSSSGTHRY